MKILVIGGGGREHALAWRLAKSASVSKVYATPGNPGSAEVAEILPLKDSSPEAYLAAADAGKIDLTVVGPEVPLAAGVVDLFNKNGKRIFGPTAAAAQLESSKVFSKQFMHRNGLPTAKFVTAATIDEANSAFDRFGFPVVLKADGLAAGKGVIIAQNRKEAEEAAFGLLSGALLGSAGRRLVIEEFLAGEEVSFIALSDGRNVLSLEPTQDHKAVHDGDAGPNTGGMGAYCDSRILTAADTGKVIDRLIMPTIDAMRREGTPFSGFLYAGLMMTVTGPKLLEFNVRCGDPETQALMHRMNGDFGAVLDAAARGDLTGAKLTWKPDPSVCVVMAAHGYPGKVRTGDEIHGIRQAEASAATVFQAGTRLDGSVLRTAGGRVLGVTASAPDLAGAIDNAYRAVAEIHFDGAHFRKDIGRKGLKRW